VILFDRDGHTALESQYLDLVNECPMMFAVLATASTWAEVELGNPLVVTSIFRPDNKASVHAYWRGVDLRVYNPARIVDEAYVGLWEDEAQQLAKYLNKVFTYGKGKGVALVHGTGMDRHLHIQAPIGYAWRPSGELSRMPSV